MMVVSSKVEAEKSWEAPLSGCYFDKNTPMLIAQVTLCFTMFRVKKCLC